MVGPELEEFESQDFSKKIERVLHERSGLNKIYDVKTSSNPSPNPYPKDKSHKRRNLSSKWD